MEYLDRATTEVWSKAEATSKGALRKFKILGDLIMNFAAGRKGGTYSSTAASKAAFEEIWERFVSMAEYEANVDPYRGIMRISSHDNNSDSDNETIMSPWQQSCEWGNSSGAATTHLAITDVTEVNGAESVRHAPVENSPLCSCPSLHLWTRQAHSKESNKRGKKRQRTAPADNYESQQQFTLGKRPSNGCECDSNPFCLYSLGGVMDDILEEKCLKIAAQPSTASKQSAITSSSSSAGDPPQGGGALAGIISDADSADDVEMITTKETKKSCRFEDVEVITIKERTNGDGKASAKTDIHEVADTTNVFSAATADELKLLRKSVDIKTDLIRSFVRHALLGTPASPFSLTEDEYMNLLRSWHKSMVFANPLVTSPVENDASLMAVSVPPGIKNLGATCYLNSQLQCLAQNLAFLEGIFSWRASNNQNHQMNSVMTKLQVLLANMLHGAARSVSTTEFSDALGLEHDEQQDPNEFARLLFERMHESFQKSSSEGKAQCKGLDNLLPSIFQGVAAYKTTCLTCRAVSEKCENFMDLNLPLARPGKDSGKSKGGLREFLSRRSDFDLQECLDCYTCPELLNGDNQYWCSRCEDKSDAERMLCFQQLPPVLNVQLSRYVFDRVKEIKKKLTDPVTLPLVLSVPRDSKKEKHEGAEEVGTTVAKYILCAVMRHQGTSAYRGHYLAEAMDWHTGQWFEFNDDNVKLLRTGPSHSYLPPHATDQAASNGGKMDPPASISGSQDAYNMYYVEESFLVKSVQQSILRLKDESVTKPNSIEGSDACSDITSAREMQYKLVTE